MRQYQVSRAERERITHDHAVESVEEEHETAEERNIINRDFAISGGKGNVLETEFEE